MLQGCRPDESPAFVHGRPTSVSFDLVFSTRPYVLHHGSIDQQDERALGEAIRLKASTVSVADGTRSEVHLAPSKVAPSSKGYRNDEYHVAVAFDLREFEHTATEKLMYGQLVVMTAVLVDSDGVAFATEKRLAARGLPVYVFEQNDQEQLLREETSEVREGVEDTVVGQEAARQESGDVMTEVSDLEALLEQTIQLEKGGADAASHGKGKGGKGVACGCVHGSCRAGESTCSGGCDDGWTGAHCDTPASTTQYERVNRNREKDFTADGLYRPQQIGDQRLTGSSTARSSESSSRSESGSGKRAQKIDSDDGPSASLHSTALQEQLGPSQQFSPFPAPAPLSVPGSATDESPQKTMSSIAVVVLMALILYALTNGVSLPSWASRAGRGAQRKYQPLSGPQSTGDQDSEDEEEDPAARRRMLELSSFGSGKASQGPTRANQDEELAYHESTLAPSRTSAFPMTSFDRKPSSPVKPQGPLRGSAPAQEEDAAEQL